MKQLAGWLPTYRTHEAPISKTLSLPPVFIRAQPALKSDNDEIAKILPA